MTDNVLITAGTGTSIATDDVGGVQYQRIKVTFGTDGAAADVSSSNPLPCIIADTVPISYTQGALVAGTALIGKVGVDQTTPGTSNAVSLAQVGSTTIASGNGVVGAGVQRVAIASDNTAFSVNAVQSGAWSLSANQSVNNAQINGVTPLMGNGVTGTGSQRVTIASDNTAFSVNAVQSGTWNIGSITTLPALVAGAAIVGKVGIDQTTPGTTNAVSLAQVGSTTVATGNGVVGAGVQRVAIASDNTAFATNVSQMNGVAVTMGSGVTGTGVQRVVLATDVALPTGANVIGALTANQSVNVAQMNGVAVTMGSGVTGTGVQRVVLATDVALPTGANVIGALTANQSVNNAQIAGVATAVNNGTASTGCQRVVIASDNTAFNVTQTPATPTASIINSAASTNATSVKGSAGTLYSVTCSNAGAAAAFVKLYNSSAAPTVGTTVIALTIPIAASGVVNINLGEMGMRFGTGIGLAITNLVGETDATAVAANQVKVLTSYI